MPMRLEREHRLDVHAHGFLGHVAHVLGIVLLLGEPLLDAPADRQVAVHRIVRAGLVGDGVGTHAAAHEFGQDLGGVAEQRDRFRLPCLRVLLDARERVVEVGRLLVDVARAQAHVDARLLAFDVEEHAPASDAASGCAPPMPPRPAVRIHLPVRSPS